MWAEANRYWYRGRLVASLNGGNVYNAPIIHLAFECKEFKETPNGKSTEKIVFDDPNKNPYFTDKNENIFTLVDPEPNGGRLRPVDITAMVEVNRGMLDIIEATTVKKILAVYEKYADKLDIFHVAFSGGKDSCVLLDLCKKTLPKDSFIVVFGDTEMEFPDTYDVIDKTQQMCIEEDIPFYIAKSHLKPKKSWKLFGPPSRTLRWCCSVHKSAPQVLKLREIAGKGDYAGLDFVGVRAEESLARSQYESLNFGKKIKGQYDCYPILDWTSAEVWLYIYASNIVINETYKKGNSRAGCLVCPMSGGVSDFLRREIYTNEVNEYIDIIRFTSDKIFTDSRFKDFMNKNAWKTRGDGRYIANSQRKYYEETTNEKIIITVENPLSNWREWVKTLKNEIEHSLTEMKTGFTVEITEADMKNNPSFGKIFRQVFKKAAYCNGCRVCEANCKNGRISFENGKLKITDCLQCLDCHNLSGGCLSYDSLKIPYGGKKMRAINSFNDHAPKSEWIAAFFELKESFLHENTLGPDQQVKFKVFLADAILTEKGRFSPFAELISKIGWDTDTAQGLILINLVAQNPQVKWYVKNLDIGYSYSRKSVVDLLLIEGVKEKPANSVAKSFKRLIETPFGTKLNWGYVDDDGNMTRTVCNISDPRVILYGLYVYNEKANAHYEFRLNSLYENIEQDGIAPTRIFGLSRETMIPILLGLTAKYPDFINATFTNDLDKISLKEDKTPADVLNLFKEGN
jgi:phosphoadenosine phosphosulfate reductase